MIRATDILPAAVVQKDLRLRMRGWRWAGVTTLYVAILALIALGFLLQKYQPSPDQSVQAGVQLFQNLAIFQLLLLVFVVPASLAGAISGERQQRTWDLLMLSRLSALEVVWGKLLGGLAFNLVLIATSVPLFGLVYLFGGVSAAAMVPAFVTFLATVLLLGSASVLVSAFTKRLTVSFMVSLIIALGLTIGLSLLALYLQAPDQPGLLSLMGTPFQYNPPLTLTPLAQVDPFLALLSALPTHSGGTVLGDVGTIHHAFGLQWTVPLWGAYTLVSLVLSLVLILAAAIIVRCAGRLPVGGV